ncbi:GumC family protein [Pseudomonas subflava]|uniref:GumC family protein n=1 Tax=Pseudomonas subflava TaxID=2952933 RepID=UPI00207A6E0C|nr:exopolysaccharide transport family protein [Pseudomonas subflava]
MIEIRTFRDLLRLFFIFLREFRLAVILTFAVVVLGAFLLPTSYESSARLLVKPGRDTNTLPIEVADRQSIVMPATQRDPILDEERLLTGRPISRQVAERYLEQLANAPRPVGFFANIKYYIGQAIGGVVELARDAVQLLGLTEEQTPVDRLATKLKKNFSVTHAPGSSVMEISFRWSDPSVAQSVVQSWVDLYMEERTRALSRRSLYDFYAAQSEASTADILKLKKGLATRLDELGAIGIEAHLQNLSERINQLRSDRFNTRRLISSTEGSLATLDQQIKSLPAEVRTVREMALNPIHQDLLRTLNAKRAEREDLLRTFTESAPPVKSIDETIASLEKRIAVEPANVQVSQNQAPNPIAERLKSNFMDQQSDLARLKAQLVRQEEQLNALEKDRTKALSIEPELARMQRELDAAEKNFVLYNESLEKARIDRELDNSQISNIAVIEQATFNPSRVFPKSLLMILLALPLSVLVGFLVVYLCYLLDQRIHDGGRFADKFGIPLWTTLPEVIGDPHSNSGFVAALYRLYGLLPLDRIEQQGLVIALTAARRGEGVSFIISHLQRLLEERGYKTRVGEGPALPGEVVLVDASALLSNPQAFVSLRGADLVALVVEAQQSNVPTVAHAIGVLNTAFSKVDGVIINRRRFEVPDRVLRVMAKVRGAV